MVNGLGTITEGLSLASFYSSRSVMRTYRFLEIRNLQNAIPAVNHFVTIDTRCLYPEVVKHATMSTRGRTLLFLRARIKIPQNEVNSRSCRNLRWSCSGVAACKHGKDC